MKTLSEQLKNLGLEEAKLKVGDKVQVRGAPGTADVKKVDGDFAWIEFGSPADTARHGGKQSISELKRVKLTESESDAPAIDLVYAMIDVAMVLIMRDLGKDHESLTHLKTVKATLKKADGYSMANAMRETRTLVKLMLKAGYDVAYIA